MTTDWEKLIPELRDWREHNKSEIDPEGWISCVGNWEFAIAYSTVFWPRFVQIDDMVFVEGTTPENVREWLVGTNGNKTATEATINHIHILHLHHPGLWDKVTREQVLYLGRTLQDIYATKLRHQFPSKDFVVDFNGAESVSLEDYQLVWYQRSHS